MSERARNAWKKLVNIIWEQELWKRKTAKIEKIKKT